MPYKCKPGELLKFQLVHLGDKRARCTMLVKEEWQQLGSLKIWPFLQAFMLT